MRRSFLIFVAISMLLSACQTPQPVSEGAFTFPAFQVESARTGEILVIIGGGPVTNKGKHWFPEGSTLARVLDWAGLNPVAPPRKVFLVDTNGHAVRCR